jgi:hypothetical protein
MHLLIPRGVIKQKVNQGILVILCLGVKPHVGETVKPIGKNLHEINDFVHFCKNPLIQIF